MRVALFGSPAFAVPVLETLLETAEVVAVVTQPAKPVGRGLRLLHPPLAARALELGLEVLQPARLKGNSEFASRLGALGPDVAVTAAYGKILPADILAIPRHGFLNVHGSLLPRWRGAAPIQWALIEGDRQTGISIMQTETGLDTGPVRHVVSTDIMADETAPELFARLAGLGAVAIREALELLAAGKLPLEAQDDTLATHARMLTRADGLVDFSKPANTGYNRYRGVAAWPGSWFGFRGTEVKVHRMRPVGGIGGAPGTVLAIDDSGMLVACAEDALLLEELQSPGRKRLPARAWASGMQLKPGATLPAMEE